MQEPGVQQLFFQHIRSNLPPHLSLVDEIADLLNISLDSAYRRIRGEKLISFDEIRTLCAHFRVSLDQLFHLNSETVLFSGRLTDPQNFSFEQYLNEFVLGQLRFMNSFEHKDLLVFNKDVPFFHYFNFQELAAFKFFFWKKTLLQYPMLGKSVFRAADQMDALLKTSEAIIQEYNKLPSQEIWNVENIHATLQQINYYRETQAFASEGEYLSLFDCLQKLVDHIESQAEAGCKFSFNSKPLGNSAPYKMFVNDFILGDNTYLALLGDVKVTYINHSALNMLWTKDVRFSEYTYQHFQNIIHKSTLISDVGEKERRKFFNDMREKIERYRNRSIR